MLNFLSGPIVYALTLVAGFGMGWQVQGWRMGEEISQIREGITDARNAAIENARQVETVRSENLALAEDLEEERRRAAQTVTETITEEVIRYVQTPASRDTGVNRAGVRLINAAARSRMPTTPGPSSSPDVSSSRTADTTGSGRYVRRDCRLGYPELLLLPRYREPSPLPAGVDHCGAFGGRG